MNDRRCGPRTGKCLQFRAITPTKAGLLWLVLWSALLAGCAVVRTPERIAKAVVPMPAASAQPDPAALQIQVQRFADDFTGRTMQALDEYAHRSGTEAAQELALRLKLAYTAAMISIASSPNPTVNLLDELAVTTMMRLTIEDHWIKTPGGTNFQVWLEHSRVLETNVWRLATAVLKPAQVGEARKAILDWYSMNPDVRSGFLARPQEFATQARESASRGAGIESVFGLVGLDPTAGLDPAVREVTRSRLFAERAMYVLQRMPFLVRWQTELMAHELTSLPTVQQVVTNTTRLSDSAERISQTAAELPDRISEERKAILDALQQQEGKLKELATELDRTLVSGEKMSTSLNTTLITFDALMKRFGVGEPDTNSVPDTDTNSPPFNILDYGKVADQISGMAKELNTLLTTANQNVTQLTQLSEGAAARADRIVDRAFHRGILLIVILLVGTVLAALTYRALGRKRTGG